MLHLSDAPLFDSAQELASEQKSVAEHKAEAAAAEAARCKALESCQAAKEELAQVGRLLTVDVI